MIAKNLFLYLLASTAFLTVTVAAEDEKEIDLKDAPEAVQQTLKTYLSLLPEGAGIDELLMETEDGETVYEAEIEVPKGAEYEIEISADGKILEVEMEEEEEYQEKGSDKKKAKSGKSCSDCECKGSSGQKG